MKKVYRWAVLVVGLLISISVFLSSCDKLNDIQEQYASREEMVYLGKVDSVKAFSGFGSVKLTWYMTADPKVTNTIVYWNLRQDSVVKPFDRKAAGVVKDSVIIDGLPEGTVRFEFRNVNDKGETSLYSSTSANIWGTEFADGLFGRLLEGFDYNYSALSYTLALTPTHEGDDVLYSEITYTDKQGTLQDVRIERDADSITLPDFPDGGELNFRTVFFLPEGIDTVYNEYAVFTAPTAIQDKGQKLAFTGQMTSKYFSREDSLYEWNADGDVSVYVSGAGGVLSPLETFSALVPRSNYRDFFHYDADKFIAISSDDAVYMYQLQDDQISPVGPGKFGSAFTFPTFIPGRGFFYSVTEGTGELRAWFAKDDATWDSPNGTTVDSGFVQYDPLIMFNGQTLLGIDAEGYLWSFPVSVNGDLGAKRRIGSGWDRFKKLVSIGTTLYGMEENGDFYYFENFNTTDNFYVEE